MYIFCHLRTCYAATRGAEIVTKSACLVKQVALATNGLNWGKGSWLLLVNCFTYCRSPPERALSHMPAHASAPLIKTIGSRHSHSDLLFFSSSSRTTNSRVRYLQQSTDSRNHLTSTLSQSRTGTQSSSLSAYRYQPCLATSFQRAFWLLRLHRSPPWLLMPPPL